MTAYSKFAYGMEPVRDAKADVGSGATAELVAAVPGKRIVVLSFAFLAGATATTAIFKSGATAISPTWQNGANSGAVLGHNPVGWLRTAVGEALNVTMGTGSTVGVLVNYVLV